MKNRILWIIFTGVLVCLLSGCMGMHTSMAMKFSRESQQLNDPPVFKFFIKDIQFSCDTSKGSGWEYSESYLDDFDFVPVKNNFIRELNRKYPEIFTAFEEKGMPVTFRIRGLKNESDHYLGLGFLYMLTCGIVPHLSDAIGSFSITVSLPQIAYSENIQFIHRFAVGLGFQAIGTSSFVSQLDDPIWSSYWIWFHNPPNAIGYWDAWESDSEEIPVRLLEVFPKALLAPGNDKLLNAYWKWKGMKQIQLERMAE